MLSRTPTQERLFSLNELEVGRGAELLVCADLTLSGYPAYIAAAQLPYDVVVDIGTRLLRLQVKGTRAPQNIAQRATHTPRYQFHVKRCGRGGNRAYGPDDFDGMALVALDIRQIAYLPANLVRQTMHLRPPGCAGTKWARRKECISDFPWGGLLATF